MEPGCQKVDGAMSGTLARPETIAQSLRVGGWEKNVVVAQASSGMGVNVYSGR